MSVIYDACEVDRKVVVCRSGTWWLVLVDVAVAVARSAAVAGRGNCTAPPLSQEFLPGCRCCHLHHYSCLTRHCVVVDEAYVHAGLFQQHASLYTWCVSVAALGDWAAHWLHVMLQVSDTAC